MAFNDKGFFNINVFNIKIYDFVAKAFGDVFDFGQFGQGGLLLVFG